MYAPTGYFARSYYGGVWAMGPVVPPIIVLVVELLLGAELAARFLGLQRLPGEFVQAAEAEARSRRMSRLRLHHVSVPEQSVLTRVLARVRGATIGLAETTVEAVHLLGAIIRMVVELVPASETARRARTTIRRAAEAIRLTEATKKARWVIIAMVHAGIRLGAAILGTVRINRQ